MTMTTSRGRAPAIAADKPANWQERAQCRTLRNPEILWPLPADADGNARAVQVCHGCPVRLDCLAEGIDEQEWDSTRGGLSGTQRRHAYRLHGRDFAAYPKPVLPAAKVCTRCEKPFDLDPARPRAWVCHGCIGLAYRKRLTQPANRRRVSV